MCVKCNSDNKCIECKKHSIFENMKNKCICKTHYLFNPKTKSCEGMIFTKLVKKCQNPSNLCKACDINDFCLKCQKNSFYDEIHKECKCINGYYYSKTQKICKGILKII